MKTNHIFKIALVAVLLFSNSNRLFSQEILSAIQAECDRSLAELKIDKLQRPFYISYAIADVKMLNINATLGALQHSILNTNRIGYPTLLVGDYKQNNLNFFNPETYYGFRGASRLPFENNSIGIRTVIWNDMDRNYKSATESFESKLGILSQQKLTEEERNLYDFEKVDPQTILLDPIKANIDQKYWENFAKKSSEIAKGYPDIIASHVNVDVKEQMTYYYNTDGTRYAYPTTLYRISMGISALTDDGQELYDEIYIEHPTFEQLPDLKTFTEQCKEFIHYMIELKNAPLIDDSYTGPVLIEKMALAEAFQSRFFMNSLIAKRAEVLAPEMRNYGRNMGGNGNNMELMMNKKVTSRSLTIKSLSGSKEYEGIKLDGYYPIDAEGVIPEKELTLVENGVLRNMLNGRSPTKKISGSNGHARFVNSQAGTRTMPGNLLLSSNDTYGGEKLKQKLIAAAVEEDLEYAYIVRRLRGDNVIAIYQIDVKTGTEKLVRGASLPDFNLRSFKRVLGASDKNFAYNTTSFGELVTYIVPEALLFEELEVTRNNNISFRQPFDLPMPQ